MFLVVDEGLAKYVSGMQLEGLLCLKPVHVMMAKCALLIVGQIGLLTSIYQCTLCQHLHTSACLPAGLTLLSTVPQPRGVDTGMTAHMYGLKSEPFLAVVSGQHKPNAQSSFAMQQAGKHGAYTCYDVTVCFGERWPLGCWPAQVAVHQGTLCQHVHALACLPAGLALLSKDPQPHRVDIGITAHMTTFNSEPLIAVMSGKQSPNAQSAFAMQLLSADQQQAEAQNHKVLQRIQQCELVNLTLSTTVSFLLPTCPVINLIVRKSPGMHRVHAAICAVLCSCLVLISSRQKRKTRRSISSYKSMDRVSLAQMPALRWSTTGKLQLWWAVAQKSRWASTAA